MTELWKDIIGYPDYKVSNFGRVKSNKKGKTDYILTEMIDKTGYCKVGLYKNGKRCIKSVHRIVMESFIKNTYDLRCINHKDENKQNNHLDNLEWCTDSYNVNYGSRNESFSCKINQFGLDGIFIKTWKSSMEAQRCGFEHGAILNCCKNRYGYRTHKGYIWKFVEVYNG